MAFSTPWIMTYKLVNMISRSSFYRIHRDTEGLPESREAAVVPENPTGEGDQPQRVFLQGLSWYSSSFSFFRADLSSSYAFHSCQKLYLHILYHGWGTSLPAIQPAPAYFPTLYV